MISKTGLSGLLASNYANETKKSEKTDGSSNAKELTKVETLKQQVQSGEYKVDLDLLAGTIADILE